jgi:hypothetical protein
MDRRFVNRRGVRTPIGALKCLIYFGPMGSIFCAEQDFDSVAGLSVCYQSRTGRRVKLGSCAKRSKRARRFPNGGGGPAPRLS